MRIAKSVLLAFIFTAFLFSCKKVEGPGGSSTIQGKLHAYVKDGAGNIINEYDLMDHDVFIIYGDEEGNNFYDDDLKTSFDGSFRFDYLEEGKYTIFLYEYCPTCPSGSETIMKEVEITDKKSTVDLGTIEVRKKP